VLSLDNSVLLTNGNPAGFASLLNLLHPSKSSFTCVTRPQSDTPLIVGQVAHRVPEHAARLTFLMPSHVLPNPQLAPLLDELTCHAAEMGAFSVLAELEENHCIFDDMRNAGFTVYAWQHIWKMPEIKNDFSHLWRPALDEDAPAIRSLYQSLVPPLVQGNEPPLPSRNTGWVHLYRGEVVAYAEADFGLRGVYVRQVFHSDLDNNGELLDGLAGSITSMGRPVYLSVRLYQSHLDRYLRDLGATESPLYAVMVKHLTARLREQVLAHNRRRVETTQVETTSGMARNADLKE
jgi:hypothetical protein